MISQNWALVQKICRIIWWQGLINEEDEQQSRRKQVRQIQNWWWNSSQDQFRWEKLIWSPFFLCVRPYFSFHPVLKKLGPSTPSLKNILDGRPEWTSITTTPSTGCPLQLSSTWTSIELTSSFVLVTQCSVGSPHI
jgi:hypothetical protein